MLTDYITRGGQAVLDDLGVAFTWGMPGFAEMLEVEESRRSSTTSNRRGLNPFAGLRPNGRKGSPSIDESAGTAQLSSEVKIWINCRIL